MWCNLKLSSRVCCCLLLNLLAWPAFGQNPATQPSTTAAPVHEDPAKPAIKGGNAEKSFVNKHQSFLLRKSQGPIDVLFLGDSITEGWSGGGKKIWESEYAWIPSANFGIGGDKTQHVLWRIANGELDDLHPQVTVLLIGTNNIGPDSAATIADADAEIVHQVLDKTGTKVLLLGVFPRNSRFDNGQTMGVIKSINDRLAKLDNGNTIRFLDIGKAFLGADGKVPKEIMADGLHPTPRGYQVWTDAMRPLFDSMVKKPATQPSRK